MADHGTTPASGDLNQDILGPNYQPPAPKYGSWGSDPRKSQPQGAIPRVDSTDKLGKASKALKNFLSRAAPGTSSKSHNPEADSLFASMLASSTDSSVLAAPEGPKRQAGGATGGGPRPGTLNLSTSQSNMDELRAQIAKEKAEKERKEREARITATLAKSSTTGSLGSHGSGPDDTHGHPPSASGEATWPGAGGAASFEGVEEILGQLTKVSDRLATAEMQKEDFKTEAAKLAREKAKLEDEKRELQFKLADLNSKYETIRNQAGFKNLEAQVLEVRRLSHYTQDLTKDLETAKRQAADAKAQLEKMQSERDQLQKTSKESADRETELQKRVATQTMIAAEMERNMRAAQDKEKEIKEKLQTIQDVHDKAFGQLREEFKTQLEDAVQQKTVVMKQAQSLQKDMNRKATEAQRLKDELTRKARSLEDALAVLKDYVDADALKNKKRSSEGMAKAYEDLKALSVKMTGQIHHKDDEITRLQHDVATQNRQIAALEVKLGLKSKHAAPSSGVFDKSKLIGEDKDNATTVAHGGLSHSRSQSRGAGVLNSPSPNSGHHVNGNSNSASFGSPQTVFSMIGSSGGATPVPTGTTTAVSPTGGNDNPFLDAKQSAGQGGNKATSSRFEEIDPDEESTPPTSFVAQPVIRQPVTVPLTISPPAQATSLAPGSTPSLMSAGQPSPSLRPAAQPLEVRIVPVQRRKESVDMGFNF